MTDSTVANPASVSPEPTPTPTPTPEPPSLVGTPPAPEPITYSLEGINFPEGATVNEELGKSFIELMNDATKSPQERVQGLVDLQQKALTEIGENLAKQWQDQQKSWQDEIRADTEFGGDKLEPALGKISQLVDKYGSPELRGVFDLTGAGNNPHVIKFLAKIANDLSEGGPVLGAPVLPEKSLAKSLYPSMK